MDTNFQTTLISGTGPYSNPNDIYNPGHKTYYSNPYGDNLLPGISGIVQNINTLKVGSELKLLQPEDAIRVFDPLLIADYIVPEDMSGLSVNLQFGSSNVITGTNQFKNF